MKQLLRLLWDPTTHELMVLAGIVGAVINVLLPGATGTYREVLTGALAALAAAGGIGDAIVQHSANTAAGNKAAATATANGAVAVANAQVTAAAHSAAEAAHMAAMTGLLSSLGGITGPAQAGPSDPAAATGGAGTAVPPTPSGGPS